MKSSVFELDLARCMASLPRNVAQSEVSIHATCDKLICCKTGWNVGGKMRHIAFNAFCSNVPEQIARFVTRFSVA